MARERRRRVAGAESGRAQERVLRGGGRRERPAGGPAGLAIGAGLLLLLLLLGWGLYARWGPAARLVAPHAAPRVLPPGSTGPDAAPALFWGSYRPQVYFGLKTRSPRSPVAGEPGALSAGPGGASLGGRGCCGGRGERPGRLPVGPRLG